MFNKKLVIEITENGPILIKHKNLKLNCSGKMSKASILTLCRCGASKTKPLCDGSHVSVGFEAVKGSIEY